MITQPEALRLADELDADSNIIGYDKHAAELRRLSEQTDRDTALLRQALEAIEEYLEHGEIVYAWKLRAAVRERLEGKV